MTSLTEFFNKHEDDALKGISHKNSIIKRNIIAHMAVNGECTLSELTKQLHISVPTITKLVQELVEENIVTDNGKVETPGGRRPNIYGLANSAIYFVGVNVGRDFMGYVVTDLQNNMILEQMDPTFELLDRPQCLDRICTNIEEFVSSCGVDRGKILGLGVCMTGRVNPTTGRSYKYFTSSEESMREIIEERVGIRTLFENDTRARCYAEYSCGKAKDENDMLYLHLGRGIAIGIVMEGKLYYGKSGFAGEFGHIPFFDNEKICACGKKGCLETEVSGIAIEEKICSLIEKGVNTILREKYDRKEPIHIDDIIAAAKNDDNLSIELIEEAGEKIGKAVAFLINIFNPETVIVGGNMAAAGDYIMLPLKSSTNKYSLNLVYKDTKFRLSKLNENANAWGVAMLIRNQVIKCGASGFLTSLGGAITLPVALPANVLSVLYMQLQMIAAIAHMGGYDLQSDRVRTLVIACLCGNQLKEVLKQAGIKVGTTLTAKAIQRLSAVLFNRINRTVTMRLLSRFGTKSAINLGKAIPLVGGLIGGGFDAYSTQIIGNKAKEMFILEARHMENGEVVVEVIDVSHDEVD